MADTDRRAYAARLAMSFAALGCEVSALCSTHHPITTIRAPHRTFPYKALRPLSSLRHAIEATLPDLVVPCDDRAVRHLHELCQQLQAETGDDHPLVKLIERSLGPAQSFGATAARYELLQLAQEEGIRVPRTRLLKNAEDISQWQSEQPLPWVLKADGTWAGRGVGIADSLGSAEKIFLTLQSPCGLKRAVKRALVNRDSFYLRDWWQGSRRDVIAQAFIPGRPANCAAACWQGKVLAQMGVEALSTVSATGPANIVRRVENPEMIRATERIAAKLQLSGFFGLDFILEEGSGAAYLLEMNPRSTPLCHICVGENPGMVPALHAAVAGRAVPAALPTAEDHELIAYFPQGCAADKELLRASLLDFPYTEPELARSLLRPFPETTFLYRAIAYLTGTPMTAEGLPQDFTDSLTQMPRRPEPRKETDATQQRQPAQTATQCPANEVLLDS